MLSMIVMDLISLAGLIFLSQKNAFFVLKILSKSTSSFNIRRMYVSPVFVGQSRNFGDAWRER